MQLKTLILLLLFNLIKVFLFCGNVEGSESEFALELTLKYLKSHKSTFWIRDKINLVSKNYFCKEKISLNKRKKRRYTVGETSTKSLNKEIGIVESEREDEENWLNKDADTIMEALILIVEDESKKSYKSHSFICTVRRKLLDILLSNEKIKEDIEKCDDGTDKYFGKYYGKQYNEIIENIIKSIKESEKIRHKKCKF
uniref:Uncharacterized protein n=1 Tax=Meloidogyne enterolobii TaxID=390850 RepID=A0A6V7UZD8_MELEN|nr:unnamed protein product [Meloidogyne enterolobii]